jgi:hypothetical protein
MQEPRLIAAKLPLSVAYARANGLNRITHDAPNARSGHRHGGQVVCRHAAGAA